MGHRALHALPAGDGYDCVRTRWGGLTVFQGEFPDLPETGRRVAERVDAVGVLRTLADTDEALFVHRENAAYLVRRLDVPTVARQSHGSSPRALVPVTDAGMARRLDGDLATTTGILGDAVDAGLIPRWMAEAYLYTFVARHPDAREVIWDRPDGHTEGGRGKPPP